MRFFEFKGGAHPSKTISEPVNNDTLLDDLKKHCSEYLTKYPEPVVFRGSRNRATTAFFADPTKTVRLSQNTTNEMTFLMSRATQWAAYPKRMHSFICSTSLDYASSYGYANAVVPFDGAKFGVCPEQDIWESFQQPVGNVAGFNSRLRHAIVVGGGFEYMDTDIEGFCQALNKTSEKFEKLNPTNDKELKDLFYQCMLYQKFINSDENKKGITFLDWVLEMTSPERNKFHLVGIQEIGNHPRIRPGVECWTDSPAYLVRRDRYQEFREKILGIWKEPTKIEPPPVA